MRDRSSSNLPSLQRRDLLQGLLAGLAVGCSVSDREPTDRPQGAGNDTKPGPMFDAQPTPPEPAPPEPVDPEVAMDIGKRNGEFAFDFYGQLGKQPGNLVYSPASIALAFAMVHAGAKGKTAAEIAKVFHLEGDTAKLQAGLADAVRRWQSSKEGLELAVANRLFGEATTPFEKAYLALTDRVFQAPLEPVDYKNAHEAARARINAWVVERTHDRIRDLVPEGGVDPSTRLVLVNAIYFKGAWEEPFSESATKPGDFFAPKGKTTASFMRASRYFHSGVVKSEGLQWAELPYQNGPYAMTIVLPDARDGLAKIEAGLSEAKVRGWLAGTDYRRLDLRLPKFKIEPGDPLQLSRLLGALGLSTPFGGNADFTGMAPASEQIQLAEAFHKAFIAVDEKGTEAAAATAVSMRAGAAAPTDEPIPFVVDRPFLFLLRDTSSGAILFMGRVESPKA
ncbi:MAG: serpin family protein [Deltaproteobacteria bacterium]|nr:serpin family protein [Nannocystaceae bacterium]